MYSLFYYCVYVYVFITSSSTYATYMTYTRVIYREMPTSRDSDLRRRPAEGGLPITRVYQGGDRHVLIIHTVRTYSTCVYYMCMFVNIYTYTPTCTNTLRLYIVSIV